MKRLVSFAPVIAILVFATIAIAQQRQSFKSDRIQGQQAPGADTGGQGKNGGRGGQRGQVGGGLFKLLDIDRDNNLSAKEIDNVVARLMELDLNMDGILSAQELVVRGDKGGKGNKRGMQKRFGKEKQK